MSTEHQEPKFWDLVRSDMGRHGRLSDAVTNPGFHATFAYRVAHWLYTHDLDVVAKPLATLAHVVTGADISRKARIGPAMGIYHPQTIFVGPGAILGEGVDIHQGSSVMPDIFKSEETTPSPVIGDRVRLGAGCKVLGNVRVGDDAYIAPNSVVLKDVPDAATALGVPARMIPAAFRHDADEKAAVIKPT